MGAVGDDPVEERLALDPLAHEPALHVGDGPDDRVDPPVADHALELRQAWVLGRVALVGHRGLHLGGWVDPVGGAGRVILHGRSSGVAEPP